MKRLVVLGSIIGGVGVLFATTSLLDHITHFIIAGHLPFTTTSIPPIAMLFFWVLVVPVVVALRYVIGEGFWQTIETAGRISQRHINRSIRWTPRSESPLFLGAVTLLYIAEQLEDESALPVGTLFSRRALSTTA